MVKASPEACDEGSFLQNATCSVRGLRVERASGGNRIEPGNQGSSSYRGVVSGCATVLGFGVWFGHPNPKP